MPSKRQPRYEPGDMIGGRFLVHKALMGGMGEVYLGDDFGTNEPRALKTFQARYLDDLHTRIRNLFFREVGNWIALEKHPNIVRCYMMDTLDNQPFMFLEWVAGEEHLGTDLRSWLTRYKQLGLQQALDITIDICRGLIYANQKQPGIVHRDLKPENILIAQGGLAKITDFGLAKVVQEAELEVARTDTSRSVGLSLTGGAVGTPPYMPPEQWQAGSQLDVRADIYAIGCILHEMLTGRWPFTVSFMLPRNKQFSAWQRAHEQAPLPDLAATIPAGIATIMQTCLAKERDMRFATVDELLKELTTLYQELFATTPKPLPAIGEMSALDFNGRGLTYDHLGRHKEALDDYTRAIELGLTNVIVYTNRGHTYGDLQRYDEALADFNRALEIDPTDAPAIAGRGSTYRHQQCYEEAMADLSHAIQLDPTYPPAYNNRALLYAELERYDEAIADYTRAIELNPMYVPAYYNCANSYKELEQYEETFADYNRCLELDPAYKLGYQGRSDLYYKLQRYDEAFVGMNNVIKLAPNDAPSYLNRGNRYGLRQRHDEARQDFNRAIELDPNVADAYYARAVAYQNLQR